MVIDGNLGREIKTIDQKISNLINVANSIPSFKWYRSLSFAMCGFFVNSPVALFLWPWYFLIESAPSELVESKR